MADATPRPVRVLLTAQEVADMFGWSTDAVYRRTREGVLPTVRVGKRVFYLRDAIDEWLRTGGKEVRPDA